MKFLSKSKYCHWQICVWKCRLPKWRPSCPGLNVLKHYHHNTCLFPFTQECVPEVLDLKKKVFAQLDTVATENMILASSSSAIPASKFTEEMTFRHRALVSHPVGELLWLQKRLWPDRMSYHVHVMWLTSQRRQMSVMAQATRLLNSLFRITTKNNSSEVLSFCEGIHRRDRWPVMDSHDQWPAHWFR